MILVYVFVFFDSYAFSQLIFKYQEGQSVLFPAEMAMTVIIIAFIMIIERFANRTDTKKVEEKKIDDEAKE